MGKRMSLCPRFVRAIPIDGRQIEEGYLYIALQYNTIVHRCPCGCGGLSEIGLAPGLRTFEYDGEKVSLWPSIGARSLKCRSHYWILGNEVVWGEELPERLDKWYEAKRREAQIKRRQSGIGSIEASGWSDADAETREGDSTGRFWLNRIVAVWFVKVGALAKAAVLRHRKDKK